MSILNNIEKDLRSNELDKERMRLKLLLATYLVICFCGLLRGSEGFMVVWSDLVQFINKGKDDEELPHVVIPLLGRFKGKTGERGHLLLLSNETNLGIKVRKWVRRTVTLLMRVGNTDVGPVMCATNGSMLSSSIIYVD